eukprot:444293_1
MDRKQSQQRLLPPATWFALIRKLLTITGAILRRRRKITLKKKAHRATFQLLQQDRCRQETAIDCPDSGTCTRCKAFEGGGMDRKQSQQRLLPPATWFALIRKLLR